MSTDVITFEAFDVRTGERVVSTAFNAITEVGAMNAYRMRWLRRGTSWVRVTYPDKRGVREYGRPEPAARYPLAVVVDTVDGHVFRAASDGELFTVATATGFAALRNSERKLGCQTYRVFKLVAVD